MDRNPYLLKDVSSIGAGDAEGPTRAPRKTFQLIGKTTSGTGSVTVDVEFSNNKVNWLLAGTITLTLGTDEASDGFETKAPWVYARGNVKSISGNGAIISLIMGL